MIILKREEEIEVYQVELALKVKTKQSLFIPILIHAQEQEEVSAETLQENLLTSLPVRACANLLKRLEQQGYFQKKQSNMFGYLQTYQAAFANYSLTELGEQSANDKSFWIGEKGVYNVFVSKSNLIYQRIIKTEKVDRTEDDRYGNKATSTPREIRQYENQILTISGTEVLIEDVESRCFLLNPVKYILEIRAKENESTLRITNNGQNVFSKELEIDESIFQVELLEGCSEFEYAKDKKAILTEFSKDNISFNREIKISKPIFQRIIFNPIKLENISHIPSDKKNAELWYSELLYKNLNQYFLDENSFDEYAVELAKPIQTHFKVSVPNRNKFAEQLSEREDAFYKIAKLETIDFLNY